MSHLSDQFLQQFLKDIKEDSDIPASLKKEIDTLYSTKKIAKGNNLKNLLNTFSLDTLETNNENSKN